MKTRTTLDLARVRLALANREYRRTRRQFSRSFKLGWNTNKDGCDIGRGSELWYGMTDTEKQGYELGWNAYSYRENETFECYYEALMKARNER